MKRMFLQGTIGSGKFDIKPRCQIYLYTDATCDIAMSSEFPVNAVSRPPKDIANELCRIVADEVAKGTGSVPNGNMMACFYDTKRRTFTPEWQPEKKINIPDQYELWASLHGVLKEGE